MSRSKPHAEALRAVRGAVSRAWATAVRSARLAVGVPDYDAYVEHWRLHHPDRAPMDREAFFRERMDARYGRGRSRCC
ncbi:YbdD/YjiX family protein [Lysobacter korlensis]|uniref:YbdD/YjiX family protein n=1 Tax=Lysobacter korlensis TaxID=553636 RepID=A0ABV6RPF9_9GAMM